MAIVLSGSSDPCWWGWQRLQRPGKWVAWTWAWASSSAQGEFLRTSEAGLEPQGRLGWEVERSRRSPSCYPHLFGKGRDWIVLGLDQGLVGEVAPGLAVRLQGG